MINTGLPLTVTVLGRPIKCHCKRNVTVTGVFSTVLRRKVKTRLREPASWVPLAARASLRNLVFTFS